MRFNRYIAFSIVASSVLCGQSYSNWNGGNLNGGDIVNITNDFRNTNPTILNSNLTINGGTVSANITSDSRQQLNGLVANFTGGNITFGGSGTINFNVNIQGSVGQPSFFNLSNNTSLTISSGISVTSSGQAVSGGIFRAQNGASLTFSGDTTINGNGNTAITMGSGALNINANGNKQVNISGNITTNGGTSTIKLDGGDTITGAYTGNGNGTLSLDIDASTYNGNVTNNGTSTINITNKGTLQGTLTTSGTQLTLTMDNGSITQSVNSTTQNNTATLTNSTITNNASFNGGRTNNVTMSGGSIGGKLTTNGGGTNQVTINNKANVNGGFDASGNTTLTMTNGTIGGTSTISGTKFEATLTQQSSIGAMTSNAATNTVDLTGSTITSLNLSGTNNTINVHKNTQNTQNSAITNLTMTATDTNAIYTELDPPMLDVGTLVMEGKNNYAWRLQNDTAGVNLHVKGDATLTANGGENKFIFRNGGVDGTLTTSGNSIINIFNDTKVGSMHHKSGTFSSKVAEQSIVSNGITTDSTSGAVNIEVSGKAQLNGVSTLGSTTSANVSMKDTGRGGTINFQASTNTLKSENGAKGASSTNTLQAVSMTGITNTINVEDGNSLTINGNATLTANNGGSNTIDFDNGGIKGTLTTSGNTKLDTFNSTSIGQGIRHSNGDFTATFNQNSQINNGIITSGAGKADVDLRNSSKLNGDSNFGSTTNDVGLSNTSQIKGNTTFSGTTNSLHAGDSSTITGQVISGAGSGTTTYDIHDSAIITGGIDTNQGAGKTTAGFSGNSILKNGTSTFHSDIDITFADNSKAISETFNVAQGTANITFKDNAEMQGGSITNNGGNANITFTNSSKMTNGEINTTAGTTKLTADTNANLTGTMTQSGGTFTADFKNASQFNGNAAQSGGTSNITFQDQAKWTGNFNQSGAGSSSTITFGGTANMEGNITTTNGTTNITFNNGTKIVGNIEAKGSTNTVTFDTATLQGNLTLDGLGNINGNSTATLTDSKVTGNIQGYDKVDLTLTGTQVDGYLHQGGSYHTQGMNANITNSKISGGFEGIGGSNNTLTIDNSQIDSSVKQSTGTLKMTTTGTIINGGFEGTNNSNNDVNMTKGQLNGGIKQNTGSLDFLSDSTNITGGFTGTSSTNTLKMLDGDFNSGNITQNGGSLKADIVSMSGIGDFSGTNNSENVIHLMDTTINDVTQDSGTLEFKTDKAVTGNISGTSNSTTNISVTGADVSGTISQNTGEMKLYLTNAKVTNNSASAISATNATFGLYADTAEVSGGITLTSSNTSGVSNALTLKGGFTQTNGTSNLTFANSKFEGDISITSATSASMIFTKSEIANVDVTRGSTSFNLTDSKMGNFSGNNGTHSVTLTHSNAGTFTQRNGRELTINATSDSTTKDITSNFSALAVSLNNSKVDGTIQNSGESTTISSQTSTITGDVQQTGSSLVFNASDTKVGGQYKQIDGVSMVNFTSSSIGGGIDFLTVQSGTLSFAQNSSITGGFTSNDSRFSFMLLSNSTLKGGFNQTKGSVTGTLDGGSSISGDNVNNKAGLTLANGTTTLSLYNNSSINDGITATDHTTTILVDHSQINGNMTINGGSFDLTAQNNSTIQSPQMQVTDAHLKLTLDTNSTFEGNLTQTNNDQEITIKQNSTFQGNITNTNTNSTIHIQTGGTLKGNLEQTNGSLKLDLSNDGNITGNVEVTNVATTLSGSGTDNNIDGNFSQTNGSIIGSMNGLTLTGTYSQTGGTSSVTFTNSAFQNNTTIKDAINSSLTFDHSTLKAYSISGGDNNTLKLLNGTTMTGNLTLDNNATATLKMDSSTIKGNIDAQNNSTLNFNTFKSEVTGTTTINTGGLTGIADSTKFGGDFTLTNTTSDVSFTNGSTINGDVTATGANSNNTIKFDASSITGNLSQTDGEIDLDLSNGSSIGGDLTFTGTKAYFTGSGAGNRIDGNFESTRTNLTGDVSGLTLTGKFTQENGTSNITFRNESNFNGEVTIKDATSSNLNFTNQSGINNSVSISGGNDNKLNLTDNSFIKGDTAITGATTTITGSNGSSIIGNLGADNSTTTLSLTGSSFEGSITQNQGSMNLTGTNNSSFNAPTTTITTGTTGVNLDTNSTLTGNITASDSTLTFNLNNNSSLGEAGNPSEITLTNSTLSITAQNGSSFNANITDNNDTNTPPLKTATLGFSSNSVYNGKMNFSNIDTTATFTGSTLNSQEIEVAGGSFNLTYTDSPNGGVITKFNASDTKLDITATGGSRAFINELSATDSTLNLLAENNARLMANVTLQGNTTATYTARTNGNLNVNTNIASQASTLDVNLKGGMLQGSFTQAGNGAGGFDVGEVTLESIGDFGGRLAITDDSQIKSLTLNNDEQILYTNALFASAFSNPMSYVDFTLDFDDTATTSRVGKEMIVKPKPVNGQPIPDAPNGQTYVRQLQVSTLSGNNGLFRVYADLGAGLADNILAQKASGDHIIQVQYRAETFKDIGGDRIVVAKVTDPTTSVSFKGTQSEIGLTRYDTEIIKENSADGQGFEWIIGQATPSGISYSSKIIASMIQSQYRNFSVEIDSLDRRLGDLKYIQRDLGVWMRGYVGQGSQEARDFSVASKDNYYSVWAGVDFNSLGLTVHNFAGAFFNYTGINTESKDYTAKGYNVAFGIYNTFKAFSGFYADLLAKYIYSSNSFEISNYSLAKNSPSMSNHKLLLNAEIGYSFYYGEKGKSGYVEPQFQVTSGYIDKSSLELVDVSGETISATMARNFPVNLRAGVFWGQVFGEKIKSHIKVGSSFAYDVNSGGDLSFKDSSTELSYKQGGDFRMILSAQTDFTFNDFFKLYASLDTSFFGDYNIVYSANFGLRMTFGRANNRVREVPVVYSTYTPPVVINDDKRTVPVVKRYTTKDIDQNYVGKPRKIESYIEGNRLPTRTPNGTGGYSSPSRQSIRDITSEVSF